VLTELSIDLIFAVYYLMGTVYGWTVLGNIVTFNPLNAELNPICYLLALLELTIFSTLEG